MLYSSACAHAIRALSQLALMAPSGNVLLSELCDSAGLPRHYVAKVFQTLVRQGLLKSSKGRGGGFSLARAPTKITLWDIVESVDGTSELEQCVVGIAPCDDLQPCPQHDQWKAMRSQIKSYLQETTLDELSRTLQRKLERLQSSPSTPG